MANVTDPLARSVHGTNPQNLIEYITRQKIYDGRYWKEECFGLTARDVAEKAATQLCAIGGSYGGNNRPTRFLCLTLKMLQIQPEEGIIDELIGNEDFKYVRSLGAFYLRLTGRPAEIYETLEPLYNDYRTLRFRNPNDWMLLHIDEFVHRLLTEDRVCGIALPRLPKRDVLVDGGHLDGPRNSAIQHLLLESPNDVHSVEKVLIQMAKDGNEAAQKFLNDRGVSYKTEEQQQSFGTLDENESPDRNNDKVEKSVAAESFSDAGGNKSAPKSSRSRSRSRSRSWGRKDRGRAVERHRGERKDHRHHHDRDTSWYDGNREDDIHFDRDNRRRPQERRADECDHSERRSRDRERSSRGKHRNESDLRRRENDKSSLFKTSKNKNKDSQHLKDSESSRKDGEFRKVEEGSDNYWNEERAKLGLKPLRK